MFSFFSIISANVKHATPEQGHFLPHEHNLNKLGRGQPVGATYKYQGSRPCGSRQEDYFPI